MERALRDYRIDADKHKLSQVFRNLISNALKFTPEGGTVSVAVCVVTHDNLNAIHIGTALNSVVLPYLHVVVTDTGHGIDKVRILSFSLSLYIYI